MKIPVNTAPEQKHTKQIKEHRGNINMIYIYSMIIKHLPSHV